MALLIIRSILAVPLQTEERVIGLIYLDSPHFVHPFTREDLNLLTVMANVAAIKIEHARLMGGLNWAGVNTGVISARRPV